MNQETKICQNCKNEFRVEPEDFAFYEKIKVPPPTWCPECRAQRRMTWRNERFLHKRECGLCKKPIISIYSPQSGYAAYCHACFRSDGWDPLSYGRDYDFSRPFFEQFYEFQKAVPRLYAMVTDCVNSEYINGAAYDKNCYLIFASDHNEDCAYSHSIFYCKNVLDCFGVHYGEWCVGSIDCEKVSNVHYSQDCTDSYNLYFCKNCANCHDCVGSVNLRNKQYCIFGKQYTKEDYEEKLKELNLGSWAAFVAAQKRAASLYDQFPVKYFHGKNNTKVVGDYVVNSKNCYWVFDGQEIEDCKYLYIVNKVKDSYDAYAIVENVELNLEVISHNSSHSKFCFSFWSGTNGTYSDTCEGCDNVFGCIGLRNKQYCILNKQYSREEYEALIPKIIDHMNTMPYTDQKGRAYKYGEFFPSELSPFAYNETVAQEFYPLTSVKATEQGFIWKEPSGRNYAVTVAAADLPDAIGYTKDTILEEVIGCEHSGSCGHQCSMAFKLIPQEYQFYKQIGLPIPRLCSNCRHAERFARRNAMKTFQRSCACNGQKSGDGVYLNISKHSHGDAKCPNVFKTTYASDSPAIVYCEQCYQEEVV